MQGMGAWVRGSGDLDGNVSYESTALLEQYDPFQIHGRDAVRVGTWGEEASPVVGTRSRISCKVQQ